MSPESPRKVDLKRLLLKKKDLEAPMNEKKIERLMEEKIKEMKKELMAEIRKDIESMKQDRSSANAQKKKPTENKPEPSWSPTPDIEELFRHASDPYHFSPRHWGKPSIHEICQLLAMTKRARYQDVLDYFKEMKNLASLVELETEDVIWFIARGFTEDEEARAKLRKAKTYEDLIEKMQEMDGTLPSDEQKARGSRDQKFPQMGPIANRERSRLTVEIGDVEFRAQVSNMAEYNLIREDVFEDVKNQPEVLSVQDVREDLRFGWEGPVKTLGIAKITTGMQGCKFNLTYRVVPKATIPVPLVLGSPLLDVAQVTMGPAGITVSTQYGTLD